MNKAVLAFKALSNAAGSEWQLKSDPGNVCTITHFESCELMVLTSTGKLYPVLTFLKEFKPAVPKDQVPTWYRRLLEDRLI